MKITLEYKGNETWHVSNGEQIGVFHTLEEAFSQMRLWVEGDEAVMDDRVSYFVSQQEREGNEIAAAWDRDAEDRYAGDFE